MLSVSATFPRSLRFLTRVFTRWYTNRKVAKLAKAWVPLYRERLKILERPADDVGHDEPFDYLRAMMRFAQRKRPDKLHNFNTLTRRLLMTNFSTMFTTTLLAHNLVLNIVGSNVEHNTVAQLRDEFKHGFGADGEFNWTKSNVARRFSPLATASIRARGASLTSRQRW
ncbi:hypothetical protein B0T25DRAFT_520968 [Lasiosphaeria hispida]|uniref:Uncharacterized protein n=1 Tax=Lasiosphaeria hispida TaxID=260671 RepID=A0AAJ0HC35_9PEZI|nr:hypothetical protein B0T25DRAFT_520968 [Lasiosphaeria hispida]